MRTLRLSTLPLLLLCVLGIFTAEQVRAAEDCEASGGMQYICGLVNPEDLVNIPGTDWVIASSDEEGLGYYLIDARTRTVQAFYTPDNAPQNHNRQLYPNCPGAPDLSNFNTHGLNIRERSPGHYTLYSVAHGAREGVEVFEIDATRTRPSITWTGCVEMPPGPRANSVASFSDGSLLTTVLVLPGESYRTFLRDRRPTGAVYQWSPGDERFSLLPGAELPGNNGIEVSRDETEFYVASSGFNTIVAFERANPTRQLRTSRSLAFSPDNVRLSPDGYLLTSGMLSDEPSCGSFPETREIIVACARGYQVSAINPRDMDDETLFEAPANPVFSNATIGIVVNSMIWVGTFDGDRIAIRVLP
jgi:hypothetical protein